MVRLSYSDTPQLQPHPRRMVVVGWGFFRLVSFCFIAEWCVEMDDISCYSGFPPVNQASVRVSLSRSACQSACRPSLCLCLSVSLSLSLSLSRSLSLSLWLRHTHTRARTHTHTHTHTRSHIFHTHVHTFFTHTHSHIL